MDYDEMLSIKWANDDPNPEGENMYSELWHKAQILKNAKKAEVPQKKEPRAKKRETPEETFQIDLPKKLPPPVDADELEKSIREEEKAAQRMKRLESILDKIDTEQSNTLAEIIFPANLDLHK